MEQTFTGPARLLNLDSAIRFLNCGEYKHTRASRGGLALGCCLDKKILNGFAGGGRGGQIIIGSFILPTRSFMSRCLTYITYLRNSYAIFKSRGFFRERDIRFLKNAKDQLHTVMSRSREKSGRYGKLACISRWRNNNVDWVHTTVCYLIQCKFSLYDTEFIKIWSYRHIKLPKYLWS